MGFAAWTFHLVVCMRQYVGQACRVRATGDGKEERACQALLRCLLDTTAERRARCFCGLGKCSGGWCWRQIGMTWRACLTARSKFAGVNVCSGVNVLGLVGITRVSFMKEEWL